MQCKRSCLQDNYQNLDPECQKLVAQMTKLESRNPYLHPIVTKACGKVVERVCGQEDKAADGAGVMECLIRYGVRIVLGKCVDNDL